jgi:2-polyprenyl-6-methoxyphenol hydroxylase-like FAD-dependent oxidoreductase
MKTTVLIVGAGPCGLAAAAELRRLGVDVTVVDAEPEPGRGSRAILLWPPVLEVFDELGIAPEAGKAGIRLQALSYHLGPDPSVTANTVRVALDPVNAPLVLPQELTSGLLEEALLALGGRVERPVRVTKVVANDDSVTALATAADGTELSIEADWLIGADGLHSQVREQLGIAFEGEQFPVTFLLAEGRIEGEIDRSEMHYFLSSSGVVLIAPLPGGEVRISGAIEDNAPATAEQVQRLLDERGPGGLRVSGLRMLTTFVSHERIAASMRLGRCFLVGDAAHVHSAIGGQGLNLGLQDARDLAWKLAGVIEGRLDAAILQSYDQERRAAAEQTLAATRRLARQAVVGPRAIKVRDRIFSALQASGVLRRWYAPMLAGWRTHYPESLLGPVRSRTPFLPRPGTRSPLWTPKLDASLAGRFQLITLGREDGEISARARALADRLPGVLAHFPLAARRERFLLLRPDGYVAATGKLADLDAVATGLTRLAGNVR